MFYIIIQYDYHGGRSDRRTSSVIVFSVFYVDPKCGQINWARPRRRAESIHGPGIYHRADVDFALGLDRRHLVLWFGVESGWIGGCKQTAASAELHRLFSPFVHLVLVEVYFYFSLEVFFYLVNLPNDTCAFMVYFSGLVILSVEVVPEMARPHLIKLES